MAKVQIDQALFMDLIRWHILDCQSDEIGDRIRAGLQEKFEAMMRRQLYTDSKTAPDAADREAARQRYLDAVGIPEDFRKQ